MFNRDMQYRCDIIRGKAQKELDNLLPAYSAIVAELCPTEKEYFYAEFENRLSQFFYGNDFKNLSNASKKTVRNHMTEIAGKLFGLYYINNGNIYESESSIKLRGDSDQPAFFKNLCLNFQFPNGMQKINTVIQRIRDKIKFKPFHFIIKLLFLAEKSKVLLNKDDVGYYVLNSKQVLQGLVEPNEVLDAILKNRDLNIFKKVPGGSKNTQHIREQLNLLALANMMFVDEQHVTLNSAEDRLIKLFIDELDKPLRFDIYKYDLSSKEEQRIMYSDWSEYYAKIAAVNYEILSTAIQAMHQPKILKPENKFESAEQKKAFKAELGDAGEKYVYELEKKRVAETHPKLKNKVVLLGRIKGLGYDISSVEAGENRNKPEFCRFIEVKSTKRVTEPDKSNKSKTDCINLTRKEWIAAQQYGDAYNIYRVYFTRNSTVVWKINNPYAKAEKKQITIIETNYAIIFNPDNIDQEYRP